MRVITPASRDVVLRLRNAAESHVRRALNVLENEGGPGEAAEQLRGALNDLREIRVEIDPAL